jgi:hypothetical protein
VSYLHGAMLTGAILRPRTSIAADRLRGSAEAMQVLATHGVLLSNPLAPHERAPIGQAPDPAIVAPPLRPYAGLLPTTTTERSGVSEALAGLVADLSASQREGDRLGETPAQYAERMWPERRIDRVRGYVDPAFDAMCADGRPAVFPAPGWSAKPEQPSDVSPEMRKLMDLPPPRERPLRDDDPVHPDEDDLDYEYPEDDPPPDEDEPTAPYEAFP